MSLRDYFAAHAPEPHEEWLKSQMQLDADRNPHGDSYKPKRRGRLEVVTQYKFQYADEMLKARGE